MPVLKRQSWKISVFPSNMNLFTKVYALLKHCNINTQYLDSYKHAVSLISNF